MRYRERVWLCCCTAAAALLFAGAHACWNVAGWQDEDAVEAPLVVFALDGSCSMLASCGEETRLGKAQAFVRLAADALPHAELALVTFGGDALLDFPPSLDREGFLNALADVQPSLSFSPGSDPGAGLALAQTVCEGRRAVVVMLTDGEFQVADGAHQGVWAERSVRLAWCVVGLGAAMPIPLGGSWLRDPDTGEVAMSRADDSRLRELCGLSSVAAVPLPSELDAAGVRAILEPLLAADGQNGDAGCTGLPASAVWSAAIACALLLVALSARHLRWSRVALGVFFSCGICRAAQGEQCEQTTSTAPFCPTDGAAYFTNRAAEALDAALNADGRVSAQEHVVQGLMFCREALREAVGDVPPETVANLQMLLALQRRLQAEAAAAADGIQAASAQKVEASPGQGAEAHEARPRGDGAERANEAGGAAKRLASDMDDALGLAGEAGASRQVPEELERARVKALSVHRASETGSWRQVIVKERPLRGRAAGVKPW